MLQLIKVTEQIGLSAKLQWEKSIYFTKLYSTMGNVLRVAYNLRRSECRKRLIRIFYVQDLQNYQWRKLASFH